MVSNTDEISGGGSVVSVAMNVRFAKEFDNVVDLDVLIQPVQAFESRYEGPVGVYVDEIGNGERFAYKPTNVTSDTSTHGGHKH